MLIESRQSSAGRFCLFVLAVLELFQSFSPYHIRYLIYCISLSYEWLKVLSLLRHYNASIIIYSMIFHSPEASSSQSRFLFLCDFQMSINLSVDHFLLVKTQRLSLMIQSHMFSMTWCLASSPAASLSQSSQLSGTETWLRTS